ncbi:MAG: sigma-70 family RNA polymerase sigma factor [Gemmatimonadetes bacterium]|nr:sigma-70 family RNA polymerase sigma factor [Gemmatimonadota bacterium]NIO31612.1 sigma-70 family RNA polymerase sigma factor [Gemmatimonadota bacterium]
MSDAILVRRARRGDAAAFEALVRRHYRAAYAVALAVLGNAMDAEDVTQDSFVRAVERMDELREPERFKGWLLQIVRNRSRNYSSYRRLRTTRPLDTVTAPGPENPGSDAERAELRRALESALATLSEVQREVVLLHDLEGWKHREIAESLAISEGMSRQHLMAARRALRERLGGGLLKEYSND